MKNLAGNDQAPFVVKEELYLAGIPAIVKKGEGEVPYEHIGKVGAWNFKRAWTYWVASVENEREGLPLEVASKLHETKNPINDEILGTSIRSGGHCACPHPKEYGADPVYNEEFYQKLEALGYKRKFNEKFYPKGIVDIPWDEICKLRNEGKLDTSFYVKTYHIDDQIGLNEFVKFLEEYIYSRKCKECGGDGEIVIDLGLGDTDKCYHCNGTGKTSLL